MEKFLSPKNILITGGTSTLGRAIVQKALDAGAQVIFTYHHDETTAKPLIQSGAQGFRLDLSDMRAIDGFARTLKEKIQVLHVLIHNAAAVRDRTIQSMSEEEWDHVLTVDLKAPYYLTKELLPLLFRKTKRGQAPSTEGPGPICPKIFFITSRVAISGGFGVSNYAAAKAGLIGLAKSLAQELGKKQILVNAVNPGFMKSKMTENLPEEVIQRNLDASPLHTFSDPSEVADFLVYLCSDKMQHVTGQLFHFESRKIS